LPIIAILKKMLTISPEQRHVCLAKQQESGLIINNT